MRELFLHSAAVVGVLGTISGVSIYAKTQSTHIEGRATVIDGDTIQIGRQRIRLSGIDAPELSQTCNKEGEIWKCGVAAKTTLEYLAEDVRIICTRESTDRYYRIIATCVDTAGTDLSRYMVRTGMAVAYRQYSRRYIEDEKLARSDRRGIWSSHFIDPATYRHMKETH